MIMLEPECGGYPIEWKGLNEVSLREGICEGLL